METVTTAPAKGLELVKVSDQGPLILRCHCGWNTPLRIDLPIWYTFDAPDRWGSMPLHGYAYRPGAHLVSECSRCGRLIHETLVSVYLLRYTSTHVHVEVPESWLSPYPESERLRDIFHLLSSVTTNRLWEPL